MLTLPSPVANAPRATANWTNRLPVVVPWSVLNVEALSLVSFPAVEPLIMRYSPDAQVWEESAFSQYPLKTMKMKDPEAQDAAAMPRGEAPASAVPAFLTPESTVEESSLISTSP